MKKNYILFLSIFLLCFNLQAQETKGVAKNSDSTELGVYPNPATQGKIYITSKNSLSKEIIIYDMIGKIVLKTTITNKELNISNIQPGVYLIQIKEAEQEVTRKLIIK